MTKPKDTNGAGPTTDEELARQYETQDPELARWLRVPVAQRTREEWHLIAARLSYWAARQRIAA